MKKDIISTLNTFYFSLFIVNIAVDNSCTYDWQCNGTQLAGSCKSSVCTCETGYMKIDNNCYQGKQISTVF